MLKLPFKTALRRLTGAQINLFTPRCPVQKALGPAQSDHTSRSRRLWFVTGQRHNFSTSGPFCEKRWTAEEAEKLCELRLAGVKTEVIAKDLGRSLGATEFKLSSLRRQRPDFARLTDAAKRWSEKDVQLLHEMMNSKSSSAQIEAAFPDRSRKSLVNKLQKIRNASIEGSPSLTGWTAEEDEELHRLRVIEKLALGEISKRLSRSFHAIETRLRVLGFAMIQNSPWEPHEDAKLSTKCSGVTWRAIVAQLPGRTVSGASNRWYYLKVRAQKPRRKTPELWTAGEDAILLKRHATGATFETIAVALPNRTVSACRFRVTQLRALAKLRETRTSDDKS
ncbi:uncharacterized protein RCC_12281 [Ramularia collo-cygni]|uniref:Myb-like domain-containing protein n=1 Tax=Ramularia collo-cygni TaxID=112498 RepID=A0A2D3UPV4_9PEZI|nr:uncharacterized protein RCC_12281 [Ramularia collo-cygni]CZT15045.1 uncharacterized protein RCC_12281 [Ramularia collo-cygni]